MSTAIEIRNLVKVFNPGKGETRAVNGVSLDIAPGELFFLLGPSGCGKTTLLRMIAGFIDPTSGRIAFNGRDVTHMPPNKRNTGMVFQSYALWPHMTVEQNVAFGLNVRKVSGADKSRRVREALEAVRLAEYAKRKPNQLSGGQQQRVALARALVIRPDVLLLDEPLSNLDAKLRIELRGEIRRICKESGITSIYVTHDQKEALSMADRVAIMDAGQVVQLGTPSICYRRPANRFVAAFLGETNFLPATVESVEDDGLTLRCSAGTLRADTPEHATPSVGDDVLCSIRPEAVRLVRPDEPGALTAKHAETVYLGELAQHTVALDGVRLRTAELNPTGGDRGPAPHHEADQPSPGGSAPTIGLKIDPTDVVVLPDPPSEADAKAHTLAASPA